MAKYCTAPIRKPFRSNDPVPWQAEDIDQLPLHSIVPDAGSARRHDKKQIAALAMIIVEYGFTNPILIDEDNGVIAGHARLAAAKLLARDTAPCIRLPHLTSAQKKALAVADNAMTDASSWDDTALRAVLISLDEVSFDLSLTGLEPGEIDFHLDGPSDGTEVDPADSFAPVAPGARAVSRPGDLWRLGPHKLLCGDALDAQSYERLLGDDRAALVFADPPYNVPISGHVSGLGRHKHREFAMASGEMSEESFQSFLEAFIALLVRFSVDGSIHYLCIDWRHIELLIRAAMKFYSEHKNICVWAKSNFGMGSLYRSQHEFIAVFKNGLAPHTNNVQLGRYGRSRSNLWTYAGANAFGGTRDENLAAHPTCKPVALVADAIRDCSKRGEWVLDSFAGSGTTILACERSGRRAAAMEIDPLYVDVAIRRWQDLTGDLAVLEGDGRTFAAVEAGRGVLSLEDHSSRDEEASQ